MKKNHIYFLLVLLLYVNTFAQVGINTDKPNSKAGLHVSERKDPASINPDLYNGVLIQRYTTAERDSNFTPSSTEDGLMIYNSSEKCYNYWNSQETKWNSICGALGKAAVTCTSASVNGAYAQGVQLTNSNYISVTLSVTKACSYNIAGTTTNGYNFTATGVFLQTGTFTVAAVGQGSPSAIGNDIVSLSLNGNSSTCSPTITILSSAGTYSMSCGSAIVNGVYKKGTALSGGNTITLPVTVSAVGSYSVTTNTVDGISFSSSGTFTSTGAQNITLSGSGNPTSTEDKIMAITSNSADGTSTCKVTVMMVIPVKKILHIGNETAYGYSAFTGPSRSLLDSPTNFGTTAASIVKSGGYSHISLGVAPSNASLQTALNNKPDIVIIGFAYTPDATAAGYFANYLNNKGVLIAFEDNAPSSQIMMRAIFSDPSISASSGAGAGSVYSLVNTNDPILNGPFGDIRGKNWGEDASTTVIISGLTSGFIPFSFAQPINSATSRTGITGFKHSSLNFVWFGDGGFISNEFANGNQYPSNIIEPFVAPSSGGFLPVEKTAYGYAGNGFATGSMQVQNSILFANAIAWAIKQAESNGINTQ